MLSLHTWERLGFDPTQLGFLLLPKEEWPEAAQHLIACHWVAKPTGAPLSRQNRTKHVKVYDQRYGEDVTAARYFYNLTHPPCPPDRKLRKLCSTPGCFNPFHHKPGAVFVPSASTLRRHSPSQAPIEVTPDLLDLADYLTDEIWEATPIKTFQHLADKATELSGLPTTKLQIEQAIRACLPSLLPEIIQVNEE